MAIDGSDIRKLPPDRAALLHSGDDHYRAYVGPPNQYDFMGATQFRLLTTLGLREHHTVLDFGCGSLRAGRLLIPYLLPGRYFGFEPNGWLIDEAIDREIGRDLIAIKQPTFERGPAFAASKSAARVDYIIANSIFSHSGRDLISAALRDFKITLKPDGLALATFVFPHQLGNAPEFNGTGWVYPECVTYRSETIVRLISECGLAGRQLPWFHPRQTWFAMAHDEQHLPQPQNDSHLTGVLARGQI